jgi:predicted Rossmann-fold nucleotide-binding protein
MRYRYMLITAALLIGLAGYTINAYAQAAGAGADFNKRDRAATAREAEAQRVEKADRPVRPDPLGNALIGGGVTGAMSGAAAGAASAVRGAAIGTAIEKAKERGK